MDVKCEASSTNYEKKTFYQLQVGEVFVVIPMLR